MAATATAPAGLAATATAPVTLAATATALAGLAATAGGGIAAAASACHPYSEAACRDAATLWRPPRYLLREAQLIIRHLKNLNLIGADVVEVSPPFDVNNMTSLVGATIAFEILCTMTKTN